jgi:hypothetical protein
MFIVKLGWQCCFTSWSSALYIFQEHLVSLKNKFSSENYNVIFSQFENYKFWLRILSKSEQMNGSRTAANEYL